MMRKLIIMAAVAACVAGSLAHVSASTLQRLSLNDMILKSTAIVQGTIQPGTTAAMRGPLIYTHYQLSVSAVYKGSAATGQTVDVAIPGGVLNGMQQPVAGAPMLATGQNYVLFLWTSKSGLTQIIGLSQGLFHVSTNAQGQTIVSRGAADATMLDSGGSVVADSDLQMPLAQLVSAIQSTLAGGNASGGSAQ